MSGLAIMSINHDVEKDLSINHIIDKESAEKEYVEGKI